MTIIEQIKAEIERLKKVAHLNRLEYSKIGNFVLANSYSGGEAMASEILSFLSTLESEKPINQDEDLDKEIKRYIDEYYQADSIVLIAHVARHFAQWGTEHLADARKMIEPEKKEGRTDCSPQGEVPNHSLATQSYENIPKDLEEAASRYAHCPFTDDDGNFHEDAIDGTAYHDFIEGAKCQKEQDEKELSEKTAAAYQLGLADKEKQITSEAVECYYGYVNNCTKVFLPEETLKGVKEGYVKIVILKNDE